MKVIPTALSWRQTILQRAIISYLGRRSSPTPKGFSLPFGNCNIAPQSEIFTTRHSIKVVTPMTK